MRLDADGRPFRGDPKSNANFVDYATDVLAVADGRVSDVRDGLDENAGTNERSSRQVTLDNVVGNYVILDLGHGRFALYAHLIPGSLNVKVGATVKAGDVLARLGNSGNSDAPHLHFQLMDTNSPLASEGLPYEMEMFTQLGVVADADALLESGGPWHATPGEGPILRRREFPVDKAVVTLPGSSADAGRVRPR
jgi:murein DD-endopeptidase MepM/ murein hydrolase activator NlpD